MANVKGKRVFLTGGAMGIGYCTAEHFGRAGVELILGDINGACASSVSSACRCTPRSTTRR